MIEMSCQDGIQVPSSAHVESDCLSVVLQHYSHGTNGNIIVTLGTCFDQDGQDRWINTSAKMAGRYHPRWSGVARPRKIDLLRRGCQRIRPCGTYSVLNRQALWTAVMIVVMTRESVDESLLGDFASARLACHDLGSFPLRQRATRSRCQ